MLWAENEIARAGFDNTGLRAVASWAVIDRENDASRESDFIYPKLYETPEEALRAVQIAYQTDAEQTRKRYKNQERQCTHEVIIVLCNALALDTETLCPFFENKEGKVFCDYSILNTSYL